jgi:hypothetical protein
VTFLNPPEPGEVAGSTATALDLEWQEGTDCGASSIAVKWYRPSTNMSVQLLGPPVSTGAVTSAVGYPN